MKSYDFDEWIRLANDKHNWRYDYTASQYINSSTKITIICRKHGSFEQLPRKHLKGSKCPKCAIEDIANTHRMSINVFLDKAKSLHNDKYNYSLINELPNLNTKITIICPIHGEFQQRAYSHITGLGCRKCPKSETNCDRGTRNEKYNTEWFINRAIVKHGAKYDYSTTEYNGSTQKITIICNEHGQFTQTAREHLVGRGCPKCALRVLNELNSKSPEDFVNESRKIHSNLYQYHNVNYVNQDTPVAIVCDQHGEFTQKPRHHLRGSGCPRCNISSGHNTLCLWLDSAGVEYVVNDRQILAPYELDIYIPSKKIGIEYHGLYWHSCHQQQNDILRHWRKANLASNANILLLQIFENELLYSSTVLKSIILSKLGLTSKVYARKLKIVINHSDSAAFLNLNCLSGNKPADVTIGLSDDFGLVCCMIFNRHDDHYQLMDYICKNGYSVVGGPSRLLKHFVMKFSPNHILSHVDRRYSDGSMYRKIGFQLLSISQPSYYYVLGDKIIDHNSANTDDCRRIYDAGHCIYNKRF